MAVERVLEPAVRAHHPPAHRPAVHPGAQPHCAELGPHRVNGGPGGGDDGGEGEAAEADRVVGRLGGGEVGGGDVTSIEHVHALHTMLVRQGAERTEEPLQHAEKSNGRNGLSKVQIASDVEEED